MPKKKKSTPRARVRQTQYARDEVTQAEDEEYTRMATAAASAYSLPPPIAEPLILEDHLVEGVCCVHA
jgi:hypothetical protein